MSISTAIGAFFGIAIAPLTVSTLSSMFGGPARVGDAVAAVCVITSIVGAAIFLLGSRKLTNVAAQ
jgi:hypothetical protein